MNQKSEKNRNTVLQREWQNGRCNTIQLEGATNAQVWINLKFLDSNNFLLHLPLNL